MIYTGRVIAGFGIGSVSLQVPVYIAETVSDSPWEQVSER